MGKGGWHVHSGSTIDVRSSGWTVNSEGVQLTARASNYSDNNTSHPHHLKHCHSTGPLEQGDWVRAKSACSRGHTPDIQPPIEERKRKTTSIKKTSSHDISTGKTESIFIFSFLKLKIVG